MSEFWALVLGAVLATIGGMLGTIFTEYLNNRKCREAEKKETYIKLLELSNTLLMVDPIVRESFYEKLCEGRSLAELYASKEVKVLFNEIVLYPKKYATEPEEESLSELITAMANQMKVEMGLKEALSTSGELRNNHAD